MERANMHVNSLKQAYMGSIPLSACLPAVLKSFALLLIFIFAGCAERGKEIDLESIDLEIVIERLDRDLFNVDIDSIPEQISKISRKYGEFFEIFNHFIIRTGSPRSPSYPALLKSFLTDYDIYRLQAEVQRVFPDLDELEVQLEGAFKRYSYFFPEHQVPQIYSYIAGFNQSIVTDTGILGIGLDKYLGSDHIFYSELQLPHYKRANMYPGKIVSDCMIGWAMTEFEFDADDDYLVNHLIYHGKLLYFAGKMLPEQHDTLLTGFSASQLEWCRNNERQMWTNLVENKLLFTTDMRTIGRFVNEGPFTGEFTRESPARAAVWLGWQIVGSYMRRNPGISLQDLMRENDYQAILNKARYRP